MSTNTCPIDPALAELERALDPIEMSRRLAPWRVISVEILKHKPGRRCSLAYTLEGTSGITRVFAKIFASERGASIYETLGLISEAAPAGILVPRPIAYVPDLRLLVCEYLDGVGLAASLYLGESGEPARRMGSALAALHGCRALPARGWSAGHELENLSRWAVHLGTRAERARLSSLRQGLQTWALRLPALPPENETLVHRDFYAEQILDCRGITAIVDLDDARRGDPAVDLGNFLAHLTLRSLQFAETRHGCTSSRPIFIEAYRRSARGEGGTGSLLERAAFYEAASLARLSAVYAGRARWSETLPAILLDACEALVPKED